MGRGQGRPRPARTLKRPAPNVSAGGWIVRTKRRRSRGIVRHRLALVGRMQRSPGVPVNLHRSRPSSNCTMVSVRPMEAGDLPDDPARLRDPSSPPAPFLPDHYRGNRNGTGTVAGRGSNLRRSPARRYCTMVSVEPAEAGRRPPASSPDGTRGAERPSHPGRKKPASRRGAIGGDEYRNFFGEAPFGSSVLVRPPRPRLRRSKRGGERIQASSTASSGGSARKAAPAPHPPDDAVGTAWAGTRLRSRERLDRTDRRVIRRVSAEGGPLHIPPMTQLARHGRARDSDRGRDSTARVGAGCGGRLDGHARDRCATLARRAVRSAFRRLFHRTRGASRS
jgi:hypothetical protein